MNNKRQVIKYELENAFNNFMDGTGNVKYSLGNILLSGNFYTNRDEYIKKSIKKYIIYNKSASNSKNNFEFYEEKEKAKKQNINFNLLDNFFEYDKYYSFFNENPGKCYFKIRIYKNESYKIEYSLSNFENALIQYDERFIFENSEYIDYTINRFHTLTISLKQTEKTKSLKNDMQKVCYYNDSDNILHNLYFVSSFTYNKLKESYNLKINDDYKENDISELVNRKYVPYNKDIRIGNLNKELTVELQKLENFKYDICHITLTENKDNVLNDNKLSYILKPNDFLIMKISEHTVHNTEEELDNLHIEGWNKKTNLIQSINDKKYLPFISKEIIDFDTFKSLDMKYSILDKWGLNNNLFGVDENKNNARINANYFKEYFRHFIDVRFVFYEKDNKISYFKYEKNGELTLIENDENLKGKYVIIYEYSDKVNDKIVSHDLLLSNEDKSSKLKIDSALNYNLLENNKNIFIKKLRLQTNSDKFILTNSLHSWELNRLFMWVDNENILKDKKGHIITATGYNDESVNEIKNNLNPVNNKDSVISEYVSNEDTNKYKSGIKEILDKGKQYWEINLNTPIIYNKIQNITILSNKKYNIYNTSLLFYDEFGNKVDNYSIDFNEYENKEENHEIFLLKGPNFKSYSENKKNPDFDNKPTDFATNYLSSSKIIKAENNAFNISMN